MTTSARRARRACATAPWILRHALRNALIPVITVFGFQVGVVFGGAVITEQVFAIPGMGRLFVQSVVGVQDYAIVQNLVMFFAIVTVTVNLLVDLSYPIIDPRNPVGRGVTMSLGQRSDGAATALMPLDEQLSWRVHPRVELFRRVVKIFAQNRPAVFGAIILFGLGLVAALAPVVAPYPPLQADLCFECVYQPPTWDHIAGTDLLGRDVLSRTIFGARIAWQVVLVAIGVAICIGVPTGLLAGYLGGKLDELLIMRVVDALMAMPALILILAMTAAVGPNIINTMLIIGIVWSAGYARLTRGVVLSVKQEPYIDAARSMGAGPGRIIVRHLLPNVVAPLVVLASLSAAAIILVEAGLSFIGAGVQQPTPAWGGMVFEGYSNLFRSAWPIMAPGVAVVLMVVSFNFVGDGLRDALDPRLRNVG